MSKPNLRPDHNGTQRSQFESNKKISETNQDLNVILPVIRPETAVNGVHLLSEDTPTKTLRLMYSAVMITAIALLHTKTANNVRMYGQKKNGRLKKLPKKNISRKNSQINRQRLLNRKIYIIKALEMD